MTQGTKVMQVLPGSSSIDVTAYQAEQRMQEDRMSDVTLMLENLLLREETTVKIIVDCLYDVGSVNLINQRFQKRPINGLMKWIARLSKPAFRLVAVRWVKRNCPKLIARWLRSKVSFKK